MNTIRIGILGYDGVAAINVAGPLEAFSNAFSSSDETSELNPCYEVSIVGCTGDQFVTDSGVTINATPCSGDQSPLDTIIVPGGRGMRFEEPVRHVADWIKTHARTTRRVASVCTGVYGLASTGLLEGRRVTTHWRNAIDVAMRFPKVQVEESALVVKDGKFYSAAGATGGIDLALFLITEDFGHKTALDVARKLLVYIERDGGQEQYSEPACPDAHFGPATQQCHTNRMGKLIDWMTDHLSDDLSLEKLAKRAMLSKNDFIQEFTNTFGIPPGLFVKNLRFNEARRRLMFGEKAKTIARSIGFADPNYFIQEFRRRFGSLPSDYQRRFGCRGNNEALQIQRNGFERRKKAAPKEMTEHRRPRIVSFTRCIRRHPRSEPARS